MRNITHESTSAFMTGEKYNSGNTNVSIYGETIHLYLHGHLIAKKDSKGIKISNAGYFTNVTKERLNGIPGVSIAQRKGIWYLNGEQWNGEWITIQRN
jgi:hypothetical protein